MSGNTTRPACAMTIVCVLVGCGASEESGTDVSMDAAPEDGAELPVVCEGLSDQDHDSIASVHEGLEDPDEDGTPNYMDDDSDGDTIPDLVEAGDRFCDTRPVDSDGDTTPDFLDTDSDGNDIMDFIEAAFDSDGDTAPDFRDPDNDGDLLPDLREIGPDPSIPLDTDGDRIADYMDIDSDNDGILDVIEKEIDIDGDGIPAFRDEDSDGDGITDEVELNYCNEDSDMPVDTDGDGAPDFLDRDSDGDGLSDMQEQIVGSSRCLVDSDGDTFDDLAEWAHPTADPTDGTVGIPPDDFHLILPPGDPLQERNLQFGTDIVTADVFFLVDTTGSMDQEIDRIKATLSTVIIPSIGGRIPDAWFGVGWFADFCTGDYGRGSDLAFSLAQAMTGDVTEAQNAVNSLPDNDGADWAESQVEALYQTATGRGLGTWVPSYGCPDGFGAPCFRPGALPVILLFTDAPMHNGPSGIYDYDDILPMPHTWIDAITVLNDIHAKVLGLDSESSSTSAAWQDLNETAVATGAVDLEGSPLVFDIGTDGEDLDTQVVDAVEILATKVPLDVDTYTRDMPDGYTDPGWEEVDATCFIKRRIPQPDWEPPPGYTKEEAVAFLDQSAFYLVLPGTRITFMVQFQNYIDEDTSCYDGDELARVFLARIIVRGDGVTDLDEREVVIIVPAREVIFG